MEIEKVYYTITEVSTMLKITPSKIRYWIKELDLEIKFREGPKHSRKYKFRDKDILILSKANELSQTGEYTLKGIKKRIGWTEIRPVNLCN